MTLRRDAHRAKVVLRQHQQTMSIYVVVQKEVSILTKVTFVLPYIIKRITLTNISNCEQ